MIDRLINSFIGITIGENSNEDSGICVINCKNELIRMDNAYSMGIEYISDDDVRYPQHLRDIKNHPPII